MAERLPRADRAGLFDGEGHIGIDARASRARSHHCPSYHLKIKLSQVNTPESRRIFDALVAEFAGSVSAKDNSRRNPAWRDALEWTTVARNAAAFLTAVRPFLILKAAQADIALAFQARADCRRGSVATRRPAYSPTRPTSERSAH